eukprot:COSAG01_NODE_1433_length_10317_cov_590.337366_11_plen_100_part_00
MLKEKDKQVHLDAIVGGGIDCISRPRKSLAKQESRKALSSKASHDAFHPDLHLHEASSLLAHPPTQTTALTICAHLIQLSNTLDNLQKAGHEGYEIYLE